MNINSEGNGTRKLLIPAKTNWAGINSQGKMNTSF